MELQFDQPATRWGEALPIGNGYLGAMIYAEADREHIELSDLTFFSGTKSDYNNQPGASDVFYKMREQISEGHYEEAEELSKDFFGKRNNYGTNLPVGTLRIEFPDIALKENAEYQRTLNIETAIASSSFYDNDSKIVKEVLASHTDHMLVYSVKTDGNLLNVRISFAGANRYSTQRNYPQECALTFCTHAYESIHSEPEKGTLLCGRAVVDTDGFIEEKNGALAVEQATYMRVYLNMQTDFDEKVRDEIDMRTYLEEKLKNQLCIDRLIPYHTVKQRHREDMERLFHRVHLDIEGSPLDQATKLVPFMFQYGRYLLYSSSREDSKLPAHLQGIWNDNVACRIGWSCDMHLDINTQMNYWPAEITNLTEVNGGLFRWIEALAIAGKQSAQNNYGLNGWVAEIVSNAWSYTAPYWAMPISPCPTGGVWILTHLWEHYQYTQNEQFLKDTCYPLVEGAVRFFVEYLFREDTQGYLSCGPSISPENSFLVDGKQHFISNGCTYEVTLIRELLQIYIDASKVLQQDSTLLQRAKTAVAELIPYQITKDGRIREWYLDYEETDKQHRHTSHLLGVFPFAQITPDQPKLAEAAQKSIETKLIPPENWEDTGWARSMLLLYEARLQHAEQAYHHMRAMLVHLLESNRMIIHPPTRGAASFANVYELDGNTGFTSGIAEMLLQSYGGVIRLLPALPKEWQSGSVSGLKARGNIEVSMQWKNGILTSAVLTAAGNADCKIIYEEKEKIITLFKHQPQEIMQNGKAGFCI